VGGGAAGVELILAMQQAMVSQHANHHLVQWHLFCTKSLLPQHPLGMQQHLRNTLAQHRIIVHEHCPIATFNVDNKVLIDAHQSQWPVHTVFWAGPAQAPAWLYASGLAASPHSGILVHPTLQSKLDPRIFASGDACEFPITNQGKLQAEYLHKAGVFAVRMGRILANNLRYHSHIKRWKTYVPQRTWLAIVRTGQGQAVASKGRWWVHGAWVWHLKHHLDTTFIKRYSTPRL
jgi:selenide,water dikinase